MKKPRRYSRRIADIGNGRYDLYKAAYAIFVGVAAVSVIVGAYLWDRANETERKADYHFGSANKPAAMKVANVVKPVSNLRFG